MAALTFTQFHDRRRLRRADITLDHPDWGHQVLVCPACGGAYLHHGTVTVFDRENGSEDAAEVVTKVESVAWQYRREHPEQYLRQPPAPLDLADRANPSDRRNGIAIAFDCELCGVRAELTIAQHKGTTLVEWRYVPEGSFDLPESA